MRPDPFQSFDAGWLLLGLVALALIAWLAFDVTSRDEPVHDDDDYDVEPRRHDPEADARHRPF
jgi:hypothetical protein